MRLLYCTTWSWSADLEPILGTPGARHEYTLDKRSIHHRISHLGAVICSSMFFGMWHTVKPAISLQDNRECMKLYTDNNWRSGSNLRLDAFRHQRYLLNYCANSRVNSKDWICWMSPWWCQWCARVSEVNNCFCFFSSHGSPHKLFESHILIMYSISFWNIVRVLGCWSASLI